MVKKKTSTQKKEAAPTLGEAVVIFTKSSSHWQAIIQPEIITIDEIRFIKGTQVTGKPGHRFEGKKTLIPMDHVASIIQFASEEEIWAEPQVKLIRQQTEEGQTNPTLTSHESPDERPGGNRHRRHRDRKHRGPQKNNDARLQDRYDSRRDSGFNR